jgi:hypothetical protein
LRAQHDAEYSFLAEFQSHEPAFDYLKSLEIDEKINSIRCPPARRLAIPNIPLGAQALGV